LAAAQQKLLKPKRPEKLKATSTAAVNFSGAMAFPSQLDFDFVPGFAKSSLSLVPLSWISVMTWGFEAVL
jgi:hypothetical protein